MKSKDKQDTIYCLIEVGDKIRDMDAYTLIDYLRNGYASFLSAEAAEIGRQGGAAYDEPGRTRVVGFKIVPFLPKKAKRKKACNDA